MQTRVSRNKGDITHQVSEPEPVGTLVLTMIGPKRVGTLTLTVIVEVWIRTGKAHSRRKFRWSYLSIIPARDGRPYKAAQPEPEPS